MSETEKIPEEQPQNRPLVRRHRFTGEFHTYEISDEQLNTLSKGIPIPLYFNFSIFLLSLSGSLVGSMIPSLTNPEPISFWIHFTFWSGIVGIIGGFFLLKKWYKINKNISSIAEQIKQVPPEGEPEDQVTGN